MISNRNSIHPRNICKKKDSHDVQIKTTTTTKYKNKKITIAIVIKEKPANLKMGKNEARKKI